MSHPTGRPTRQEGGAAISAHSLTCFSNTKRAKIPLALVANHSFISMYPFPFPWTRLAFYTLICTKSELLKPQSLEKAAGKKAERQGEWYH